MSDTEVRPWWERVSPALVEEYVALARDTRQLQTLYRRTQDPMMRRELPDLEGQFDRLTDRLARELAADRAADQAEGGAA